MAYGMKLFPENTTLIPIVSFFVLSSIVVHGVTVPFTHITIMTSRTVSMSRTSTLSVPRWPENLPISAAVISSPILITQSGDYDVNTELSTPIPQPPTLMARIFNKINPFSRPNQNEKKVKSSDKQLDDEGDEKVDEDTNGKDNSDEERWLELEGLSYGLPLSDFNENPDVTSSETLAGVSEVTGNVSSDAESMISPRVAILRNRESEIEDFGHELSRTVSFKDNEPEIVVQIKN
ncbi:hypothetical protein HK096_010685 [Nowakowskiella sp. JEL0078]|nr:hypothetical protein HK096_010685 [Nowakowskiella sp. JEL0078]